MEKKLDIPSIIKNATHLKLQSQLLAESMKFGNFRSLYNGQGIEFFGVRDYFFGDDIRTIDWNVTARMNKPFVKTFEEDKELQVFIIFDTSLSVKSKGFLTFVNAITLLIFACEFNSSPCGTVFFDEQINFSCKPKNNKNQTLQILSNLEKSLNENNTKPGSVLDVAINGANNILTQKSLVFILSDFCSFGWEIPLQILSQKHKIVAIHLENENEKKIKNIGTTIFNDVESGTQKVFSTNNKDFQNQWENYYEKKYECWKTFCLKNKIIPVSLKNNDNPFLVLNGIFSKGKRQ